MTLPGDYIVDGGGIACLGAPRRSGERLADLRRPLAVACELARNDLRYKCYVDDGLPYRVREEDRSLLDLLLSEHPERFPRVPQKAETEDFLFQRAGSAGAAIVTAAQIGGYVSRFPWLGDQKRHALVTEADGLLTFGSFGPLPYRDFSAFDIYDRLLPSLTKP